VITVPGFLLRRLYVKGSLRATEEGLAFEIKNSLGSGYARGMLPLTLDGADIPMKDSHFTIEDSAVAFTEVTKDVPFTLAFNRATTITAVGISLTPGTHKVSMAFDVQGLGTLRFDFTDVVPDG
jgi:hypothetical protein